MKMCGLFEDDKFNIQSSGEMVIRFVDPTSEDNFSDDDA
jgi:hypothetical protein